MSRKKIPPDAFEFYYALGPGRSYRQVAEHFGVSKTAVANLAEREDWQTLVSQRDAETRKQTEQKTRDAIEEMRQRHLKIIRLMQKKAYEALGQMTLGNGMDGIRTLVMSLREERLTMGEPTERTAMSLEDTIRREYERWMAPADEREKTESNGHEDHVDEPGEEGKERS